LTTSVPVGKVSPNLFAVHSESQYLIKVPVPPARPM